MLRSYLKIAWRNLWKNPLLSFINSVGLVLGFVFCFVIFAYVWQEQRVNTDLKNIDQQYLISSEYKNPGYGIPLTTIGALPKALKEEYPHLVSNYYRLDGISCIVASNEKIFKENAAIGDSTLLTMYGLELIEGNPLEALKEPFSVVITEALAQKYFGTNRVLNKALSIQNFSGEKHDFKITGILKTTAENSIVKLNDNLDNGMFFPLSNVEYFGRSIENWDNVYVAGFVELKPGVTPKMLEVPMKQLVEKHADPALAENLIPVLKSLKTYHLDSNGGVLRKMLLTLSLIAVFILTMAVINFINITVSKAASRLKEIGIRKVLGSQKSHLIIQLGIESLVMVFIASLFALAVYPIFAPILGEAFGKTLPNLLQLPLSMYLVYGIAVFAVGVLSGIYPALRLTSLEMLDSVKGKLPSLEKAVVRKGLLGFQFIVAMVVLISSVIISKQVSLFFGKDIGFNKDYLITAQVPRDWTEKGLNRMESIRTSLAELPEIQTLSLSYDVPTAPGSGIQYIARQGDSADSVAVQMIMSDEYYADAYGVPMLKGDFFSPVQGSAQDLSKVVISNKVAQSLGFNSAEEAIGQPISLFDHSFNGVISGVSNDFYFNSMHQERTPIVWLNLKVSNQYRYFTMRLTPGSMTASLQSIEKRWKELMPDAPFEYKFMDMTLENIYQTELQLKRASVLATGLSAIIVFLGIVGLVSLSIQQRMKEIGIRKVLGSSVLGIISLFLKDFIGVFLVSIFMASALVYWMMGKWLENYYIKTALSIELFLVPIMALGGMVVLLIGIQTIRGAVINPVDSLREE